MRRYLFATFVVVLLGCFFSAPVAAQETEKQSHFGAVVSFGLPSSVQDSMKILFDADRVDIRSQDFEVGFIVRGRDMGGDWGVSYSQKSFKDGSVVDNTGEACGFPGPVACQILGTKYIMRNVQLRGVSVHKFVPFVTIKRRVQVGLTFAGGVAQVKGTAEMHDIYPAFSGGRDPKIVDEVSTVPASELFLGGIKTVPLWRVEITGAAILAPGLKVRFGTGINFTNYLATSVSVSCLFGSR